MRKKSIKASQKQRTTLKDVAQRAGVSTAAASLVLNNKPNRFTDSTKDIIRQAASELGYVPNQSARSLATQSSSLFALIIPDIENLFFASLAKHLEDECRQFGYSLLIANTSEDKAEQARAVARMIQLGVDGLFIVPAYGSFESEQQMEKMLQSADFPVVFIDRYPAHMQMHAQRCAVFAYDHKRGGALVAQLFADQGHKRIAAIGPLDLDNENFAEHNDSARFFGFIDELKNQGIPIDKALLKNGQYNVSSGYDNADIIIDHGVSAVFCGNDLIALGFMRRAHERGVKIPDDISIVGYDDVMESFGLDFNLTTVRQDIGDLVSASVRRMLKLSSGKGESSSSIVSLLEPHIVERATVKNATV